MEQRYRENTTTWSEVLRSVKERGLGAPPHQQSLESILSGVRLPPTPASGLHVRKSTLYPVFKLVLRLSLNWRGFNGPNQLRLLLDGDQFRDGQLVLEDVRAAILAHAGGA